MYQVCVEPKVAVSSALARPTKANKSVPHSFTWKKEASIKSQSNQNLSLDLFDPERERRFINALGTSDAKCQSSRENFTFSWGCRWNFGAKQRENFPLAWRKFATHPTEMYTRYYLHISTHGHIINININSHHCSVQIGSERDFLLIFLHAYTSYDEAKDAMVMFKLLSCGVCVSTYCYLRGHIARAASDVSSQGMCLLLFKCFSFSVRF
jgi:hypothetical protein